MTYQKLLKEQMKRADNLGKEETAVKLLILELSGKDGASFLANQELHQISSFICFL